MAFIPTFNAPLISASKLSPIIIEFSLSALAACKAKLKTLAFGFLTPTDSDVTTLSK